MDMARPKEKGYGAIQVLRKADRGGGGDRFSKKTVTKV